MGAYGAWGMYRENPTFEGYNYYGMDCDGLVNWCYKNVGLDYNSILGNSYYHWTRFGLEFSKENGDVGDVLRKDGHVAIIVGKTDNYFIVAEVAGESLGIVISQYSYSGNKEYVIIDGNLLIEKYTKTAKAEYPAGF